MQNLRALRVAAGKKQSEMAEIMGVERSTYVKWETGRNLVDVGTLVRLAEYFNVSTDYILDSEINQEDKRTTVSPHEMECIEVYRSLNPTRQNALSLFLKFLCAEQKSNTQIDDLRDTLDTLKAEHEENGKQKQNA